MLELRYDARFPPVYMTQHSVAADLRAREAVVLAPAQRRLVGTGVRIVAVNWDVVPRGYVPEISLRARSGLALRHGVTLLNGVGTVDADYRDEIKVLLWNGGEQALQINAGDRIAQMLVALSYRLPCLERNDSTRQGGFGSTDYVETAHPDPPSDLDTRTGRETICRRQ